MANNPVSYKKYKVLSTVFADITPIQNLTVRIQFGADYSHATTFMQSFPSYVINNEQGTAGRNSSDVLKLSETATANYRWALNDDHSFNFMLGQEAMDYQASGFQVVTKGQSSDFLTNISSGTRALMMAVGMKGSTQAVMPVATLALATAQKSATPIT